MVFSGLRTLTSVKTKVDLKFLLLLQHRPFGGDSEIVSALSICTIRAMLPIPSDRETERKQRVAAKRKSMQKRSHPEDISTDILSR